MRTSNRTRIRTSTSTGTPPPDPHLRWTCTWLAGPDAGGRQHLTVGRHVLGRGARSGAELGADDPALEPHHALLEVFADGRLEITRLAGRTPIVVAGRRLDATTTTTTTVHDGDRIEIGHSLVECTQRAGMDAAQTGTRAHVRDGALVRTPRTPSSWSPPAIDEPLASTAAGLTPAALALAGAGVMALVLHQTMFFVFGLVGAFVAAGTWVAQRVAIARTRRRNRHALAASTRDFAVHHRRSVHTIVRARDAALALDASLWARRARHHDAYLVSPGIGDVPCQVDGAVLTDVPVGVHLGPGVRLAIRGPHAAAVARSLVLQLATACGPADLRLAVAPPESLAALTWRSLTGLPHLAEIVDDTHVVHLTDRPDLLALRTSPLRRALADAQRHALIVVLAEGDAVPHLCTHVCTTTDSGRGSWATTGQPAVEQRIRTTGCGIRSAADCVTALRALRDPEDPLAADDDLPAAVALHELLGSSITAAWARHAQRPDAGPSVAIGVAADGVVDLDLVRDGPHALIAGTTGSGKSELLRSMVLGMAAQASPQHLTFVLVDYKGGATFDDLVRLPHVVGVVTDLEADLADRVLRSLHAELRRREGVLRDHRVPDLPALRARVPQVVMPRLVVVIDEFAALVGEQPEFLHALLGIAQRGRSLGVHLVLATQRPNGVISDDIRANTNLRIALRLHDTADAIDVVGTAEPTRLPRHRPGRAVVRLGADEYVTFQTATSEAGRVIRSIVDAATSMGCAAPPAPWTAPLPFPLTAPGTPAALGVIDDPDHQTTHPLCWSPDDGNVLVVGSPGSGTSTTLDVLVQRALAVGTHHVYRLVDHDRTSEITAGAVTVRVHERELVARLLHRLAGRHQPRDGATGVPPVVLVIDTIDGVRRALDGPADLDLADALDALLQHHDPSLVVLAAAVRPTAVPSAFLARCAHRWVHHLHDPHDATHLGVAGASVPPPIPGRLRIAATGLLAQIAAPRPTPRLVHPAALAPPAPIELVPNTIDPHDLPPVLPPGTDHDTGLALGIGLLSGATVAIDLRPGEHLTVLGGARSGRTTTLLRLATAWREHHPAGTITVCAPRRTRPGSPDEALRALATPGTPDTPATGPHLVVVDDADLVDEPPAGAFDSDDTSVVIAARPDALRQLYGHWTTVVRRSRTGLVAVSGNDLDGDLLGTLLPRRTPVAARPGLAWCVVDGTVELVQVAADNLGARGVSLSPR